MTRNQSLEIYHEKRDFRSSPEPEDKKTDESDEPRFVIQKHDASNLHYDVRLEGNKLRGGYALVRMGGDEERWLLIKMDDEAADARRNPVNTEPDSVLTGRSLEEIRSEEGDEA